MKVYGSWMHYFLNHDILLLLIIQNSLPKLRFYTIKILFGV